MKMDSQQSQPLLPRISMRWYFVLVLVVAFLVSIVFQSSNPKAWGMTLILLIGATLFFFITAAICFLVAFAFGAVKQIVFYEPPQAESPFANETLPPQVIPPHAARD
jgi:hypothetical protein